MSVFLGGHSGAMDKNSLLSKETAEIWGLEGTGKTVDDVLRRIADMMKHRTLLKLNTEASFEPPDQWITTKSLITFPKDVTFVDDIGKFRFDDSERITATQRCRVLISLFVECTQETGDVSLQLMRNEEVLFSVPVYRYLANQRISTHNKFNTRAADVEMMTGDYIRLQATYMNQHYLAGTVTLHEAQIILEEIPL